MQRFTVAITILFLANVSLHAATIHVPADQPTIQAGIDTASAGDTVLVACGTYYEHDIVMKSDVCLTGASDQSSCVVIDAQNDGCGISCDSLTAGTSVEKLTITNANGGGIRCVVSSSSFKLVTIKNSHSSGFLCINSSPFIQYCTFEENEGGFGGGMYCIDSSPIIENCKFRNNWIETIGGGMYTQSSIIQLNECAFTGNRAVAGGGLFCDTSIVNIDNCTFVYNRGIEVTGGIHLSESQATIINTIVAFSTGGCGVDFDAMVPTLSCSDIYGNQDGDWIGGIADQNGINGNISSDPLFCDPDLGDFNLRNDSPCAPENNNCGVLMGAWPVGCSTSAESATWSDVKALY